jgi:hypothetical protein
MSAGGATAIMGQRRFLFPGIDSSCGNWMRAWEHLCGARPELTVALVA